MPQPLYNLGASTALCYSLEPPPLTKGETHCSETGPLGSSITSFPVAPQLVPGRHFIPSGRDATNRDLQRPAQPFQNRQVFISHLASIVKRAILEWKTKLKSPATLVQSLESLCLPTLSAGS